MRYSRTSRTPITVNSGSIHRGVGRTGIFWARFLNASKSRLPDPRMRPARNHTVRIRSGQALRSPPMSTMDLSGSFPAASLT